MTGRCAGCGFTNANRKKMKSHILACGEYLKLWRSDKSRALEPEAEYERWREETSSAEFLADVQDRRLERRQEFKAVAEHRTALAAEKWSSTAFRSKAAQELIVEPPSCVPAPCYADSAVGRALARMFNGEK